MVIDRAALERQFNPSSCLPDGDYRPYIERYRTASDEAWATLDPASILTMPYGTAPSQTIDLALPPDDDLAEAPLLVFFHGGYWQELSKLDSRFAAARCVERGWAFAAVDYTLAPEADLDTIVEECRSAVAALVQEAPTLGFSTERIALAGSSAGAHLAAMVATTADVAGAVLVSGIFELEGLIGLSIDEALGLDVATARRNSPMLADLQRFPPTVLAHGSDETDEFKEQSARLAARLTSLDVPNRLIEIEGRNHFDVVLDLVEPATVLGDAVTNLIDSTGGTDAQL